MLPVSPGIGVPVMWPTPRLSASSLVLGKHSGRHALRSRLKTMGYDLSDEEINLVFTRFKELADKKKHVVDEDLEVMVTEGILRTSDIFKLDYLHVTSGTTVLPMASVELSINGRPARNAGYGNGPIDAAFNTIAKLTGTQSELLRFTVSALSGGTDSQGEVTVRLRENGLVATSNRLTFVPGKSYATSSCRIPQGGNAARVRGRSGAM